MPTAVPCGGSVSDHNNYFYRGSHHLADAGPDSVICEGDNFTFDASQTSASNYSEFYLESTAGSGDGTFTNPSSLSTYLRLQVPTDISAGRSNIKINSCS